MATSGARVKRSAESPHDTNPRPEKRIRYQNDARLPGPAGLAQAFANDVFTLPQFLALAEEFNVDRRETAVAARAVWTHMDDEIQHHGAEVAKKIWPKGASVAKINAVHGYSGNAELKLKSLDLIDASAGNYEKRKTSDGDAAAREAHYRERFASEGRRIEQRLFVLPADHGTIPDKWLPGTRIFPAFLDRHVPRFVAPNLELLQMLNEDIDMHPHGVGKKGWTKGSYTRAADLAIFYANTHDVELIAQYPLLPLLSGFGELLIFMASKAPTNGSFPVDAFKVLPQAVQQFWRQELRTKHPSPPGLDFELRRDDDLDEGAVLDIRKTLGGKHGGSLRME